MHYPRQPYRFLLHQSLSLNTWPRRLGGYDSTLLKMRVTPKVFLGPGKCCPLAGSSPHHPVSTWPLIFVIWQLLLLSKWKEKAVFSNQHWKTDLHTNTWEFLLHCFSLVLKPPLLPFNVEILSLAVYLLEEFLTWHTTSEIRGVAQTEHSFHLSYKQEHFCALSIKICTSTSEKTHNLRGQVESAIRVFKTNKQNKTRTWKQ